jgi:adenylate cyclase class 2
VTSREADPPRRKDEIEIKLPCEDLSAAREKLRELGATPRTPLHFESNDMYDDPAGSIAGSGRALRLRRAGDAAFLTFKGPARFEGGVKVREERETNVSDPAETAAILAALGFAPRFRYEKKREEWTLEDCAVALDETPIGNFVEVEGDPPSIRRAVNALGLDFTTAVPYTYSRLYAEPEEGPSLPADRSGPSTTTVPCPR